MRFYVSFIPKGVYSLPEAYISERCATIKYGSDQYLELYVTPEEAHIVVQFDCNSAMTCVSKSDLQAFYLPENLQNVFLSFQVSGKNWYNK